MLALYGRPDTWEWLLFFHILIAVVLVAATLAVTIASFAALRASSAEHTTFFRKVAFRINLLGVLPGFVATIVIAGALADKEFPGDDAPGWLEAGWTITFLSGIVGGILLTLLQWWVLRRARNAELRGWQATVATYVAPVILGALFVVLFLMAGKPGQDIPAPV